MASVWRELTVVSEPKPGPGAGWEGGVRGVGAGEETQGGV